MTKKIVLEIKYTIPERMNYQTTRPVSSKDIEKTWQKSLHQEIQGNRIFSEILKHISQTTHPVVSSNSSVHSTIAIKQKMMITKK